MMMVESFEAAWKLDAVFEDGNSDQWSVLCKPEHEIRVANGKLMLRDTASHETLVMVSMDGRSNEIADGIEGKCEWHGEQAFPLQIEAISSSGRAVDKRRLLNGGDLCEQVLELFRDGDNASEKITRVYKRADSFGVLNREDEKRSAWEHVKVLVLTSTLTLAAVPLFPRMWTIVALIVLSGLHVWQWKFAAPLSSSSSSKPASPLAITDRPLTALQIEENGSSKIGKDDNEENEEEEFEEVEYTTDADDEDNSNKLVEFDGKQPSNGGIESDGDTELDISRRDMDDVKVRVTSVRVSGNECNPSYHAQYRLDVTTPDGKHTWHVWHPYSEFCTMHSIVERVLESDVTRNSMFTRVVPSIPSRRSFVFKFPRFLFWRKDKDLIHRRRLGLDEFVKRVFGEQSDDHYRKLALRIPHVRQFLGLAPFRTKPKQKHRIKRKIIKRAHESGKRAKNILPTGRTKGMKQTIRNATLKSRKAVTGRRT